VTGMELVGALVPVNPASGAVAFAGGYVIGALPVAWLMVRRWRGIDLRDSGGTGSIDALRVAGPLLAFVSGLIELLKGGAVGIAAELIGGHSDWFTAAAIAGCVLGDAFPVGFRRGGRGLVPLVSGLLFALPLAGLLCALIALPVAAFTRMRGSFYDAAVVVAVPLGLMIGTFDWRSLAPGAAIVVTLVARSRLRRAAREKRSRAALDAPPNATIVDLAPTSTKPTTKRRL